MTQVTIHEAKSQLSRLLVAVEAGQEVIIARGKKPIAKIVGYEPGPERVPGRYEGQFTVPDAFFEPMSEDELALWYGEGKN